MKNYKNFLFGLCISGVFIIGFLIGKNDTTQSVVKQQESSVETNTEYQTILDIGENDFKNQELYWRESQKIRNINNYSDAEIRILREKQSFKSDGGYIYTPGRVVPSLD